MRRLLLWLLVAWPSLAAADPIRVFQDARITGAGILIVWMPSGSIRGETKGCASWERSETLMCVVASMWCAALASADPVAIRTAAAPLYSNTQDTRTTTGVGGTNHNVLVDDVLVPAERNPRNRPLAITAVTMLVSGVPGEAATLSLWHYPVLSDGSPGFGRELIDTARVVFPSPLPFLRASFGNGSSPLFTVRPDFVVEPGFGLFSLGLGSSRVVGWQWADGPDVNRATAYNHNLGVDRIFLNKSPGPPFPAHDSYFLEVQGSPVPEPATMYLVAAGLLSGLFMRRLQSRTAALPI
ncbi:MAG: hypothetical protein V7647_1290 [Acidobacteriota bacterium]|jgi:hypothetical protein